MQYIRLLRQGISLWLSTPRVRPYGFYKKVCVIVLGVAGAKLVLWCQNSQEEQSGRLAVSRRQHYIYWQMSRRARGLSTTFEYYDWDQSTKKIFQYDRKGNLVTLNVDSSRDIRGGLPLQRVTAREQREGRQLHKERALAIAYMKHIDNRYELRNYLKHKPYTIGDLFRAAYYWTYIGLGLTNKYRYDHFLTKPDCVYQFEKLRVALCVEQLGVSRWQRQTRMYEQMGWLIQKWGLKGLWSFVFWNYL